MTDKNRIRVGSRDSALAVVQSKMAIAAMQNLYTYNTFKFNTMSIKRLTNTNKGVTTMEEFYKAIEDKIKASGYPGEVNGEDIYNDICDQMEEKENGTYLFLSKKDNGVVFEYKVDILDESFNLSYVHITANNDTFHIDFDN